VKDINLVINYDIPHDAEDYVHRIGRTARVDAKGEAITLVTQKELYKLRKIEQLIKTTIPKLQPPEHIGPVPSWKEEIRTNKKRNFSNKKRFSKASHNSETSQRNKGRKNES
jgi:superfamily II DNA/RNA helicase